MSMPRQVRDRFEPVLDAGEAAHRAADRVGRDAEEQADCDRSQNVADVVLAGQWDLAEGHDPAPGPSSPNASESSRRTSAATIQPSRTPTPPGSGTPRR